MSDSLTLGLLIPGFSLLGCVVYNFYAYPTEPWARLRTTLIIAVLLMIIIGLAVPAIVLGKKYTDEGNDGSTLYTCGIILMAIAGSIILMYISYPYYDDCMHWPARAENFGPGIDEMREEAGRAALKSAAEREAREVQREKDEENALQQRAKVSLSNATPSE